MNSKILTLQNELKKNSIDEIVVSDFYNLKYFANVIVHAGERLLALIVNQNDKPTLIANKLFNVSESEDYNIIWYDDIEDSVAILSKYLTGKTVAIDDKWPSGFLIRLLNNYQAKFVSGSILITHIRSIKNEEERELMRISSKKNDKVMNQIVPFLKVGVTENEIHDKLTEMFAKEFGGSSFDAIVAFGPNGADPHHMSDDTVLKEGDMIIIDMGGDYKGYMSDMTRTYFCGENTKFEEIYDICHKANLAAEAMIKPGVKYCEIDKAARSVIEEAGYGKYFTHRTGHGIGLEVHEGYDVSSVDEVVVEEGMCFSIEPGIYLTGFNGVRVEDLVMVTKDGCEVLNSFTKEKTYVG